MRALEAERQARQAAADAQYQKALAEEQLRRAEREHRDALNKLATHRE
jgi:hypothetical protein